MANKIKISTDFLQVLSARFERLQDELSSIEKQLARIDLYEENGGDVRLSGSYRLSDGSKFTGSDVSSCVSALQRAAKRTGSIAARISDNILTAADCLDDIETALVQRIRSMNLGGELVLVSSAAASTSSVKPDLQSTFSNFVSEFSGFVSEITKHVKEAAAAEMRAREAMKKEYQSILQTSDPASNPRIYEIIAERLEACDFDQHSRELIVEHVRNAPANYRDIFIYSFYQYDIKNGASSGNDGIYVRSENTMYVDSAAFTDQESFIDCFFHEAGHAVDANNGLPSMDGALLQNLERDTTAFINEKIDLYADKLTAAQKNNVLHAFMDGQAEEATFEFYIFPKGHAPDSLNSAEKKVYNKVVEACYTELKGTSYESDCMPWDILTGMTNNTISPEGGHRKDYAGEFYWFNADGTRTGNECQEAWAEFFSSRMTGDAYSQIFNNYYMTNSLFCMMEIAHDTAQEYRLNAQTNNAAPQT